eukprot:CAMPEP_0184244620 /NCGR_PEP_ID=MMETSP0977-20130417/978_1 /TAXON_ID=483370 /ORGANISM="non described non described, Strain CCMP2097" /LENGTH=256 /DNA_ID=CAMNT_0026549911 /DNA_START=29 /DNA_END=799 /DNA_ORIENTATION=-
MWTTALLVQLGVAGALLAPRPARRVVAARGPVAAPLQRLQSSNAPMYDGTNYTLPDASTAAGAAALLEVSFVNACLQLASGYVDTLKLFIASATGAFECGLTVDALELELSMATTQTAGRPLAVEESDLRSVWLALVYLTLVHVGHPSQKLDVAGASVPAETAHKFEKFVSDIVAAEGRGHSLQTLKLEEVLRREEGAPPLTQLENAVLSQSMRVVFLTLMVVGEISEARSQGNNSRPGPQIPGTERWKDSTPEKD